MLVSPEAEGHEVAPELPVSDWRIRDGCLLAHHDLFACATATSRDGPTVKPSASSSAERSAMPVKVADADLKRPIDLFA